MKNVTEPGMISWCYRSVAAPDLGVQDILDIVEQSQRRNAEAGVTGVLFYDHGKFLQWLEGPVGAVEGIMGHILRDPRHGDLEILAKESITHRRFANWHMQLCCGAEEARLRAISDAGHVVTISADVLPEDGKVLSMDRVLAVRRFLAEINAAGSANSVNRAPRPTMALCAVPSRGSQRAALVAAAGRLSDLLNVADPLSRIAEIEAVFRAYGQTPGDFGLLYEAYAEALLEQMREDRVSGMQAALACAALQMVLRRIHHTPDPQNGHGAVTVAATPGEMHFLEATISGEILRSGGWSTSVVYPQSDADLIERLKVTRTATVVLASSRLDPMDHDFRLIRLIGALRAEPDLPRLRIVVGGRLAQLPVDRLRAMGADTGCRHLLDVLMAVARVACPEGADCGSMRACRQPHMQCCDKRITSSFLLANVMPSVLSRMTERHQHNERQSA